MLEFSGEPRLARVIWPAGKTASAALIFAVMPEPSCPRRRGLRLTTPGTLKNLSSSRDSCPLRHGGTTARWNHGTVEPWQAAATARRIHGRQEPRRGATPPVRRGTFFRRVISSPQAPRQLTPFSRQSARVRRMAVPDTGGRSGDRHSPPRPTSAAGSAVTQNRSSFPKRYSKSDRTNPARKAD